MHDDGVVQEISKSAAQGFVVGAGAVDQATPFHCSAMGGVAVPLMVASVPIAVQASAPEQEIVESGPSPSDPDDLHDDPSH